FNCLGIRGKTVPLKNETKTADRLDMNIKEFWELCKLVLTDWRVIFIAIFFIVFSSLAGYVVKYKKKPPKPKKK
ncbi:MAG: hypothetical protein J6W60_01370, partial [Treponema sp.]|nr:hypothetical protein [Treponema sp.]